MTTTNTAASFAQTLFPSNNRLKKTFQLEVSFLA